MLYEVITLLFAGVQALLNAPDLGLTLTQTEGRYSIENVRNNFV